MPDEKIESVQQAFEEFEREVVRVRKEQNDAAKEVHPQIRDTLAQELDEHIETFLSGSYSRKVQVVRLKDIDIIVVLDDPTGEFAASAEAALEAIRKAVTSPLVRSARKRGRSVRLTLYGHEFTIDLVAAREPGNGDDALLLATEQSKRRWDYREKRPLACPNMSSGPPGTRTLPAGLKA